MGFCCLPYQSSRSRMPTTIDKMLNNADGWSLMTYHTANRFLRNVDLGLNSRDIINDAFLGSHQIVGHTACSQSQQ